MVKKEELEALGWEHKSTMKNGGSKTFVKQKGKETLLLEWHGDNFMMKRSNSPTLNIITIKKLLFPSLKQKTLWEGIVKDHKELQYREHFL